MVFSNYRKVREKIHLLKQSSKPHAGAKQRRKISIFGTLDEYKESKKKPLPIPAQSNNSNTLSSMFANQGTKENKNAK